MNFEPIGYVYSCFSQRFGVPRQAGVVPDAKGIIRLKNEQAFRDSLKSLEEFSHLWVIFVFHDLPGNPWKPRIRPPRLYDSRASDGSRKVGVLASRSPHRPNPIGLSAVKIERIDIDAPEGPEIHVTGIDLQDHTPVLDIKPYIPYADSIPDANPGWSATKWAKLEVSWQDDPLKACQQAEAKHPGLQKLVEQTLASDPRPPYYNDRQMVFKTMILDYDVHWEVSPQENGPDRCLIVKWIDL